MADIHRHPGRNISLDLVHDYINTMLKIDAATQEQNENLLLMLKRYDGTRCTTEVNNKVAERIATYVEASKNIKCVTEITKLHDAYIHGRQE